MQTLGPHIYPGRFNQHVVVTPFMPRCTWVGFWGVLSFCAVFVVPRCAQPVRAVFSFGSVSSFRAVLLFCMVLSFRAVCSRPVL